jgi:hypothetical protein
MKIVMQDIPFEEMRYPTIGDYWDDRFGKQQIEQYRVARLGDWKMEFLVLLHEFIESHLNRSQGISEPDVKKFDEMFEEEVKKGLQPADAEPGFDPRAPYRDNHSLADLIEVMVAYKMGVNMDEYNAKLEEIWNARNGGTDGEVK